MKTQRHHNESGIALILTLTILAVVLILLMAFITSMRTERISAKAFSDLSKAKALAEGAVDEAVAMLQGSMTNITPTTSYITAPGVIYTWSAGTWNAATLSISGAQQDLNTSNAITGAGGVSLQVGWQKVFTTDTSPQIIGRFTYWIDDESTKVNLNTAQLRANDPLGYTPAAVDLSQLFSPAEAGNISTYVANTRPLDSIESIKLSNTVVVGAPSISPNSFSNNEFLITANATSPDLTPWGSKRLNLSNLVANATTLAQKQLVVTTIANALSTNTMGLWDGTGKTFANKYNAQQIAANIVDYIDVDSIPTDSTLIGPLDTGVPAYLGLERTPYLNEISMPTLVTGGSPSVNHYSVAFNTSDQAELWYMYMNADWVLPAGTTEIAFLNRPTITVTPIPPGTVNGVASVTLTLPGTAIIPVNGGIPVASPYRSFSKVGSETPTADIGTLPLDMTTNLATIVFNSGNLTAIFRNQTLGRFDFATIPLTNYTINFDANAVTPTTVIWASACNDPRVKPVSNNWIPVGNGMANAATIFPAGVNTGVLNFSPPGGIAGDGDASCHTNSINRDRGTMYPSELAYIHTGFPWRTFWLEPQPAAESGSVPDWLAVDLFSTTDTTNVAGRINVNAQDFNTASPPRVLPLNALLGNLAPPAVADNILNYAVHTSPTAVSFVPAADKYFTTAGQICEVNGLADGGGQKSTREAPAIGIVNLVTTRSDTFTIWAMAQGIKKVPLAGSTVITQPKVYVPPPSGTDLITGEVKIQAVVQRYEDNSSGTPVVRFRTLYYRYIYQ